MLAFQTAWPVGWRSSRAITKRLRSEINPIALRGHARLGMKTLSVEAHTYVVETP